MEKKEYKSAEMNIVAIKNDILTISGYIDSPQVVHDYYTAEEEL